MKNESNIDFLEQSNLEIDDEMKADKLKQDFGTKSKKRRIIYLVLFIIFATINTIIYTTFKNVLGDIFKGEEAPLWSIFFFGCAIWGFGLALLFSLIPKKGSTYKTRYLNVSLLIMFIFNAYFTLIGSFIILNTIT